MPVSALLGLLALHVPPRSASAAENAGAGVANPGSSAQLIWVAPEGCPSAEEASEALSTALRGKRLLGDVTARVDVVNTGTVFKASLTVESSGVVGKRELNSSSCSELARATAVLVSLLCAPPPDVSRTEPMPVAPSPSSDRVPDRVTVPPAHGTKLSASLGWALALGVLPDYGTGPVAGAELDRFGGYFLSLSAMWLLSRELAPKAPDHYGGRFGHARLSLVGGQLWGHGRLRLGPCLSLEGGASWGEGTGVTRPLQNWAAWAAIDAGVNGRFQLGGMLLDARAVLGVPFLRPRFELVPYGETFSTAAWTSTLVLALALPVVN